MNARTDASTQASIDIAVSVATKFQTTPGGLLPALHGIQDALGYIPKASVTSVAEVFNLSRAEVHGVITYYHHFRSEPAGKHVVQVCRAEACQARGADALMAHAEQRLNCRTHHTTADGVFTLEPVYCLGLCATGPAIMIGEEVHAHVDAEAFDELVQEAGSAA